MGTRDIPSRKWKNISRRINKRCKSQTCFYMHLSDWVLLAEIKQNLEPAAISVPFFRASVKQFTWDPLWLVTHTFVYHLLFAHEIWYVPNFYWITWDKMENCRRTKAAQQFALMQELIWKLIAKRLENSEGIIFFVI